MALPLAIGMAPASASAGPEARVPVLTRLVQAFSEREGRVAEAVAARDDKALSALLSDDFELRTGAVPGTPTPRGAWIHRSFTEQLKTVEIAQIAVHEVGDAAVVSFLWGVNASGAARSIFVVDVWRREAGAWKLAVRYADPTGRDAAAVPGTAPASGFEKRE